MFLILFLLLNQENFRLVNRINQDLQGKQKAADITNKSIIILLTNILPSHVGQFLPEYNPKAYGSYQTRFHPQLRFISIQ